MSVYNEFNRIVNPLFYGRKTSEIILKNFILREDNRGITRKHKIKIKIRRGVLMIYRTRYKILEYRTNEEETVGPVDDWISSYIAMILQEIIDGNYLVI